MTVLLGALAGAAAGAILALVIVKAWPEMEPILVAIGEWILRRLP